MIELVLMVLSGLALALGCFFMLSGAVGLLRFPDFYTRMHAAGMTDTLATFLVVGGLMLLAGWSLALFKLGLILLFIFFTSPTASHALARAAQHGELRLADAQRPGSRESRGTETPSMAAAETEVETDTVNVDRA